MKKINLSTVITRVGGEPLTERVENKKTKKVEDKPMTVRDYLLIILGQRFDPQSTREIFWTTQLGIQCADEKNSEIEVAEDKVKFLIRLVKINKIKLQGAMGQEQERELFFPYEKAQLLSALMSPKEIEEWLEEEEVEERLKAKTAKKETPK